MTAQPQDSIWIRCGNSDRSAAHSLQMCLRSGLQAAASPNMSSFGSQKAHFNEVFCILPPLLVPYPCKDDSFASNVHSFAPCAPRNLLHLRDCQELGLPIILFQVPIGNMQHCSKMRHCSEKAPQLVHRSTAQQLHSSQGPRRHTDYFAYAIATCTSGQVPMSDSPLLKWDGTAACQPHQLPSLARFLDEAVPGTQDSVQCVRPWTTLWNMRPWEAQSC